MFTLTTRAALSGLPRAMARPLVLRPVAPLAAQRGLVVSAWNLKESTGTKSAGAKGRPRKDGSAASTKKKPAAKKETKTKTTTKTKTKAAAKPKPKTKAELSPEQLEKAAAKKEAAKARAEKAKRKLLIAQLKEQALLADEPSAGRMNAWTLFYSKACANGTKGTDESQSDLLKRLSADFKRLSESELEELRASANADHEISLQARKKWIESHPAEVIYMAQLARKRLAKLLDRKYPSLDDERLPAQRGSNGYIHFIRARWPRDDGGPITDHIKNMVSEWNALSEDEKRRYNDEARLQSEEVNRRKQELLEKGTTYWAENSKVNLVKEE